MRKRDNKMSNKAGYKKKGKGKKKRARKKSPNLAYAHVRKTKKRCFPLLP